MKKAITILILATILSLILNSFMAIVYEWSPEYFVATLVIFAAAITVVNAINDVPTPFTFDEPAHKQRIRQKRHMTKIERRMKQKQAQRGTQQ